MYIQITDRCNMSCVHCCSNCTQEGTDMTIETFRNALVQSDEVVSLGGGEPTIHPLFWQFLGESIASAEYIWLATNGSMTATSLALAKMAKRGIIGCELSQDEYHDSISAIVYAAFTEDKKSHSYGGEFNNDGRGIRNTSHKLINAGRCDFGESGCVCEDPIIKPDGTVKGCGCDDAPILGNINDPTFTLNFENDLWWEQGGCSHDQDEEIKALFNIK